MGDEGLTTPIPVAGEPTGEPAQETVVSQGAAQAGSQRRRQLLSVVSQPPSESRQRSRTPPREVENVSQPQETREAARGLHQNLQNAVAYEFDKTLSPEIKHA